MLRVNTVETFATQDWPGIRVAIFLQGCMFKCLYCHNPDTIPMENEEAKRMDEEQILDLAERNRPYFANGGGITFSGGEPLLQAPALLPIVKRLKAEGYHICIDTNGFVRTSEALEVIALSDLILPDLKQINPKKHLLLVWQENTNTLATLEYLEKIQKPYWLRYVLVPGLTDDEEDLHQYGKYVQTLKSIERLEILPYHNLGKEKRKKLWWEYPLEWTPAATAQDVHRALDILKNYTDKTYSRL